MSEDWRPSCSLLQLQQRARLLTAIRRFFSERCVLEVETPLLCQSVGTDPNLDHFQTDFSALPGQKHFYLQTSPEFAMKRLLAGGSGSIFQICKAFRKGETGRFHNPEFTMLEWYRLDFKLPELLNEIIELIQFVYSVYELSVEITIKTYQQVFTSYCGFDPLIFDLRRYKDFAISKNLPDAYRLCGEEHALWLDFIFSHVVQPMLRQNKSAILIYHYPACLSSLARLNQEDSRITERVELFIDGVELGNGYYELLDPIEQDFRFDQEISYREQHGLPVVTKDHRFLAALRSGLPDCSGMAIGFDRLLMLLTNSKSISEVLAFPVTRA